MGGYLFSSDEQAHNIIKTIIKPLDNIDAENSE